MKKEYSIQCRKCGEIIKVAHVTPDNNLKFDIEGEKADLIIGEYGNIPILNEIDLNKLKKEFEELKKEHEIISRIREDITDDVYKKDVLFQMLLAYHNMFFKTLLVENTEFNRKSMDNLNKIICLRKDFLNEEIDNQLQKYLNKKEGFE